MQIPAAFIIRGRTDNNDFPYNFLVSPEDFSAEKTAWARKFAVDSTRYFELSRDDGRRVIFCDDEYIVSGISIEIGRLCEKCGREVKYAKVEGNRNNYAFMGFVFRKGKCWRAFDIPYEMFLEQYKRYMSELWEIPPSASGLDSVSSSYEIFSFPEMNGPELPLDSAGKLIIDARAFDVQELAASITQRMWKSDRLSFCSNLPNGKSVIESDFSVVTSYNADAIAKAVQKAESRKQPEKSPEITYSPEPEYNDSEYEGINEDSSSRGFIESVCCTVKKLKDGLLIICGAVAVFISGKVAKDYFFGNNDFFKNDEGGFIHED